MGAHDENASCLRSGLCPGRALPATSLRPQGTPSTLKHSRARPAGERGAPRACCAISASLAACPGGWPRSRSDSSAAMRAPARRDTAASLLPGSPSSRMAASRRAHSRRSAVSASPPASPAAPARPRDSLCHRPRHHALEVLGSPSRAAAAACAARCSRAISCIAASARADTGPASHPIRQAVCLSGEARMRVVRHVLASSGQGSYVRSGVRAS